MDARIPRPTRLPTGNTKESAVQLGFPDVSKVLDREAVSSSDAYVSSFRGLWIPASSESSAVGYPREYHCLAQRASMRDRCDPRFWRGRSGTRGHTRTSGV